MEIPKWGKEHKNIKIYLQSCGEKIHMETGLEKWRTRGPANLMVRVEDKG
jgi:hypothetical protein